MNSQELHQREKWDSNLSTQRCGTAACDGEQQLFVLAVNPLATAFNEGCPAQRTMSATSRGGRFMRSASVLLLLGSRSAVQLHAWMLLQEVANELGLVGGEVVEDDMNLLPGRAQRHHFF
jgi:hypothetical protein